MDPDTNQEIVELIENISLGETPVEVDHHQEDEEALETYYKGLTDPPEELKEEEPVLSEFITNYIPNREHPLSRMLIINVDRLGVYDGIVETYERSSKTKSDQEFFQAFLQALAENTASAFPEPLSNVEPGGLRPDTQIFLLRRGEPESENGRERIYTMCALTLENGELVVYYRPAMELRILPPPEYYDSSAYGLVPLDFKPANTGLAREFMRFLESEGDMFLAHNALITSLVLPRVRFNFPGSVMSAKEYFEGEEVHFMEVEDSPLLPSVVTLSNRLDRFRIMGSILFMDVLKTGMSFEDYVRTAETTVSFAWTPNFSFTPDTPARRGRRTILPFFSTNLLQYTWKPTPDFVVDVGFKGVVKVSGSDSPGRMGLLERMTVRLGQWLAAFDWPTVLGEEPGIMLDLNRLRSEPNVRLLNYEGGKRGRYAIETSKAPEFLDEDLGHIARMALALTKDRIPEAAVHQATIVSTMYELHRFFGRRLDIHDILEGVNKQGFLDRFKKFKPGVPGNYFLQSPATAHAEVLPLTLMELGYPGFSKLEDKSRLVSTLARMHPEVPVRALADAQKIARPPRESRRSNVVFEPRPRSTVSSISPQRALAQDNLIRFNNYSMARTQKAAFPRIDGSRVGSASITFGAVEATSPIWAFTSDPRLVNAAKFSLSGVSASRMRLDPVITWTKGDTTRKIVISHEMPSSETNFFIYPGNFYLFIADSRNKSLNTIIFGEWKK